MLGTVSNHKFFRLCDVKYKLQGAVKRFPEFLDIDGLMHHDLVLPGQRVTGHFYMHVLQRLRNAVRRKRSNKRQGQRFLHHDNAPSHTSLVEQKFLTEKNIPVITQPLYSPDLAPKDFFLFPTL
jgi:histone-lysine N-methyltransferase SETMAR